MESKVVFLTGEDWYAMYRDTYLMYEDIIPGTESFYAGGSDKITFAKSDKAEPPYRLEDWI